MFTRLAAVPSGPWARLRRLRRSLNTPVVALESMPVGPAAAGIALHEGPRGARLTLALRSVRTGQVVCFSPDEEWVDSRAPQLALDAALSFAESMGFLFDDDPIEAGGDPREAAGRWAELLDQGLPEASEELWPEPTVDPTAPLLSKFRLFDTRPARRRAAAPPADEVRERDEVWIRLLSCF
jgi:hypothetical protein